MSSLKTNRFIQAFLYLMLISAALHIFILVLYFTVTLDYSSLNFFEIIGLNLFYPTFVSSISGNYLSIIVMLGIYFLGYKFLTSKK